MPMSRAPPPWAGSGMPTMPRSMMFEEDPEAVITSLVGVEGVTVPVTVAPRAEPVNCRSPSRIIVCSLNHLGFVRENGVHGADGDATEGGDGLAVELFETKQDVGLVHRLEIEVGPDDTVRVDHGATHVGADHRGVGSLDGRGGNGRGRQPIQCTDEEVDQVRRGEGGWRGGANVGNPRPVAPRAWGDAVSALEVLGV